MVDIVRVEVIGVIRLHEMGLGDNGCGGNWNGIGGI